MKYFSGNCSQFVCGGYFSVAGPPSEEASDLCPPCVCAAAPAWPQRGGSDLGRGLGGAGRGGGTV